MSLEQDPLLPRSKSAPEIAGYGYSKASQLQAEIENDYSHSWPMLLRNTLGLFMSLLGFALLAAMFLPGGTKLPFTRGDADNETLTMAARVDKILSENPLIDGHNDLAILIRFAYGNKIYEEGFKKSFEQGGLKGHVDLPRLEKGKSGGAFWSAFVPCPKNGTDFCDENYAEAVSTTLSQLDLLHRLVASYPQTFVASTANSTSSIAAFRQGKFISPIGIEGLHQIGNSYANLRLFESLGARYVTLTHNCHNKYADAALVTSPSGDTILAPPYWGGVSKPGQELIKEMNRIGLLVDISHVSKNTMIDVLGGNPEKWSGSAASVIFSHSSAYALCPHPRNVPDDVLKLVKKTNSLVMVNIAPEFISCKGSDSPSGIPDFYPPNSTLHQVARHIIHIGNTVGFSHVGIGTDFDGIFDTPEGLDDVSKFPDLIAELLRLGVTDEDAAKVIGGNILRVWSDAEKTAIKMAKNGVLPAEDAVRSPFNHDLR